MARKSSVQFPREQLLAFISSARTALWPAIVLSSFAFAHLLKYDLFATSLLAINLCLIASLGFLLNDALDTTIDEINKEQRWSIKTRFDGAMFSIATVAWATVYGASYAYISTFAFVSLFASAFITVAYSLVCKRILLLGNIVAAGLSITPGLIMFLDVRSSVSQSGAAIWESACFLALGFLLFVSREVKFDQFDRKGDIVGNRLTLPMVFSGSALNMMHAVLGAVSLIILLGTLTIGGRYPWQINGLVGAGVTLCAAVLLVKAYWYSSQASFYKITRVLMLLIPISMFASF